MIKFILVLIAGFLLYLVVPTEGVSYADVEANYLKTRIPKSKGVKVPEQQFLDAYSDARHKETDSYLFPLKLGEEGSKGMTHSVRYGIGTSEGYGSYHQGVDFGEQAGRVDDTTTRSTAVIAMEEGTVKHVGTGTGAGYWCVIEHEGFQYRYMHLLEHTVLKVGDKVNKGDLIGYMGATGGDYGKHLHVDIKAPIGEDGIQYDMNPFTGQLVNESNEVKDGVPYTGDYNKMYFDESITTVIVPNEVNTYMQNPAYPSLQQHNIVENPNNNHLPKIDVREHGYW